MTRYIDRVISGEMKKGMGTIEKRENRKSSSILKVGSRDSCKVDVKKENVTINGTVNISIFYKFFNPF